MKALFMLVLLCCALALAPARSTAMSDVASLPDPDLEIDAGFYQRALDFPLPTLREDPALTGPSELLAQGVFTPELFAASTQPSNTPYWYKLNIRGRLDGTSQRLSLVSHIHILQRLDFYLYRDGQLLKQAQLGVIDRLQTEDNYRGVVFDFTIDGQEELVLLIRKQSAGPNVVAFALQSEEAFAAHSQNLLLLWGIVVGMLAALALYNALIYAFNPGASYLWYLMFQGVAFLEFAALYGFGYLLMPDQVVRWLGQHISMLNFFLVWAGIMFAQRFLRMDEHAPRLERQISRYQWLLPALSPLGLVLPEHIMMLLFAPVFLLMLVLCIASAVIAYRRHFTPAKIYLLSWVAMLGGGLVAMMTYSNLLPQTLLTLHAFLIGALVEMYLLSVALAKRLQYQELKERQLSFLDPELHMPNRHFYYHGPHNIGDPDTSESQTYTSRLILLELEGLDNLARLTGSALALEKQVWWLRKFDRELLKLPWLQPISLDDEATFSGICMTNEQLMLQVDTSLPVKQQLETIQHLGSNALDADRYTRLLKLRASVLELAEPAQPGQTIDRFEWYRCVMTALTEARRHQAPWLAFDQQLDQKERQSYALLQELQAALKNGELTLYVQPQFNIHTEQVVGGEALMRWFHPKKGAISPGVFIPLAEKSGLIFELTCLALEQMFAWKQRYPSELALSINLSVLDLRQKELVPYILDLLDRYPIDTHSVVLEITESQDLESSTELLGVLRHLRHLGFKLSVDDFGTGYSSMIYLSQLKADEFKIDRAFIRDIDQSPANQSIVTSLLTLAKSLNAQTVIEGIETEQELQRVRELGGSLGQGFYWSAAIDAEQFAAQYLSGEQTTMPKPGSAQGQTKSQTNKQSKKQTPVVT